MLLEVKDVLRTADIGVLAPLRDAILHGDDSGKPGWVRLSLHYAMDEATVAAILDGVRAVALNWEDLATAYSVPQPEPQPAAP